MPRRIFGQFPKVEFVYFLPIRFIDPISASDSVRPQRFQPDDTACSELLNRPDKQAAIPLHIIGDGRYPVD